MDGGEGKMEGIAVGVGGHDFVGDVDFCGEVSRELSVAANGG